MGWWIWWGAGNFYTTIVTGIDYLRDGAGIWSRMLLTAILVTDVVILGYISRMFWARLSGDQATGKRKEE